MTVGIGGIQAYLGRVSKGQNPSEPHPLTPSPKGEGEHMAGGSGYGLLARIVSISACTSAERVISAALTFSSTWAAFVAPMMALLTPG